MWNEVWTNSLREQDIKEDHGAFPAYKGKPRLKRLLNDKSGFLSIWNSMHTEKQ